jgi:SAM-dependent methyltransferase
MTTNINTFISGMLSFISFGYLANDGQPNLPAPQQIIETGTSLSEREADCSMNSESQSDYPSISMMSKGQINAFKKVERWTQNRVLFPERSSWSDNTKNEFDFGYWGRDCYLSSFYCESVDALKKIMSDLNGNDIYLDVGAGDGHAIHQYRDLNPNGAKAIGIALTQPGNIERVIEAEKRDEKFSFFLCDFKEFPTESLAGRVSVITDIKAAFCYGLDPAGVIQKMGTLLKEGGLAIIDFGYYQGIHPPSQIENISYLENEKKIGSRVLLHLWFHTIKGFDVLKPQKDFEKSLEINSRIMEKPNICDIHRFGENLIILRRNSQPVEADKLIPDPEFVHKWSILKDSEKNYDSFSPNYTWETSGTSETLLSKLEGLWR